LWLLEDGPGWTIVDCGYALPAVREAWERIFAERLGGRPVRRILVTHYHPDHIGLSGWLAERWQAPLWISEKEWLHARMMTGNTGSDYAEAAAAFARRAGLDTEDSRIFGERHSSYAAACRGSRRHTIVCRTAWRSRSAGANGGSLSARATRRSWPAFIAPKPAS
jgi:phosphoribosyl 1,2-cyclic phosphodiesterase